MAGYMGVHLLTLIRSREQLADQTQLQQCFFRPTAWTYHLILISFICFIWQLQLQQSTQQTAADYKNCCCHGQGAAAMHHLPPLKVVMLTKYVALWSTGTLLMPTVRLDRPTPSAEQQETRCIYLDVHHLHKWTRGACTLTHVTQQPFHPTASQYTPTASGIWYCSHTSHCQPPRSTSATKGASVPWPRLLCAVGLLILRLLLILLLWLLLLLRYIRIEQVRGRR